VDTETKYDIASSCVQN